MKTLNTFKQTALGWYYRARITHGWNAAYLTRLFIEQQLMQ